MTRRATALVVVVGAGTVAATVASLVTGEWLLLVAWVLVALVLVGLLVVPGGRARPVYDEGGVPVACPNCGGTTFSLVRSSSGVAAGFLLLGWLGALVAPKSRMQCATCGATYSRVRPPGPPPAGGGPLSGPGARG